MDTILHYFWYFQGTIISRDISMTSICKLERIVTLTYYLNVIKQGENVHKERTINGDNSPDACFSDSAYL